MDIQGSYAHYDWIFPFHDAPDIGVRVLWYPVPEDTPPLPFEHIFPLRGWDIRDQEEEPQLGTKYTTPEIYTGPKPLPEVGHVCGTADQWLRGVSYADYLAGHYSCDCPGPTMPPYVSSVSCDDGSLFVSAPTGDVVLRVNLAAVNHWTVTQYFQGATGIVPAAVVTMRADQVAAPLQVQDISAHPLWTIAPGLVPNETPRMTFGTAAASNLVVVSNQGMNFATYPGGAPFVLDLTNAYAQLLSNFFFISCTGGNGVLQGRYTLGPGIDSSYGGSVDADWVLYLSGGSGTYATALVGDRGGGPELLQVDYKDGGKGVLGHQAGGTLTPDPKAKYFAQLDTGTGGFSAQQDPGGVAGQLFFEGRDKTGATMFAVDDEGFIRTGAASSPSGTGTIILRLEIRDQFGALLGYLPIYDTL